MTTSKVRGRRIRVAWFSDIKCSFNPKYDRRLGLARPVVGRLNRVSFVRRKFEFLRLACDMYCYVAVNHDASQQQILNAYHRKCLHHILGNHLFHHITTSSSSTEQPERRKSSKLRSAGHLPIEDALMSVFDRLSSRAVSFGGPPGASTGPESLQRADRRDPLMVKRLQVQVSEGKVTKRILTVFFIYF